MKKIFLIALITAVPQLLHMYAYAITPQKINNSSRKNSAPKLVYLANAYAYPVPFRPNFDPTHTKITFTGLPSPSTIKIYTVTGEHVATIEETDYDGVNNSWDPYSAASGMYIYIIEYGSEIKKGQLLIVK